MRLPCDQREQQIYSISTPQITGSAQKVYTNSEKVQNTDFLLEAQLLFWSSQILQGSNNTCIRPPNFEKNAPVSNTLIHRLILVVCDTNRYENPPIVCKILISSECAQYYTRNIRPLKLNTTISKYIAFLNRDKLYPHPCEQPNTPIYIEEDNSEIDNKNTQSISEQCLKKLALSLGDAIIVDDYSHCGYSVIYPNQIMDKEEPVCSLSPKCSIGTQHGEGLESLDEYKVAFDFANNHGYGFVEFVDVTHVSRASKKKKTRPMPVGECMYSTSHHMKKETFSIKYQSNTKNKLDQWSNRFCSQKNSKRNNKQTNLKQDIDIVDKIKDSIAQLNVDDGETDVTFKPDTDSHSKKQKTAENSYRKIINERYGRHPNNNGIGDVGSLNTKEPIDTKKTIDAKDPLDPKDSLGAKEILDMKGLCRDRSEGDAPGVDTEELQSPMCNITFNTSNECEKPKLCSIQNNNNDAVTFSSEIKCDKYNDKEDRCDIRKVDDLLELGKDDNKIRMSKARQNSLWERIRKYNPFKSVSCTVKVFTKCHSPCTNAGERSRSLKVEKVQIDRVEYKFADGSQSIEELHDDSIQSEVEEKEAASFSNSDPVRFRPVEKLEKRSPNPSRCRPKPKTLRNSNVRRLFQMCGGRRRFFSSTNLTKDNKDNASTTSLENKYRDATSGDFTRRISEACNKQHMLSSTSTANAHGDVVTLSGTGIEVPIVSHQLGDQKLHVGFGPTSNTYECNKVEGLATGLIHSSEESEKNNNKSEPKLDSFDNSAQSSRYIHSEHKDISKENINEPGRSGFKETNCGNIMKEDANNTNQDTDLNNCNNNSNANAEEGCHESNDTGPPNHQNAEADAFRNVENFVSSTPSKSDLRLDNDDNSDTALNTALTGLVEEQDADNYDNFVSASSSCDHGAHSNFNSSKVIQKNDGRPNGRQCPPSADASNESRSYVLSSPRRSEVRESDTDNQEINETASSCDNDDEGRSPGGEMECPHADFPPINMHQRNMVYCPTTENYWAPSGSPRLAKCDNAENESNHHTPGSVAEPHKHLVDQRNDPECRETDDVFRLVDSCITETESKLGHVLDGLYRTINQRLSSLEVLVTSQFDMTQNMIENLRKQNMNRSMNKIEKESESVSEAIHLNTEATKSSIPDIFPVKNTGNHKQSGHTSSNETANGSNTFHAFAFTEMTPSNNRLQSPGKLDDTAGTTERAYETTHQAIRRKSSDKCSAKYKDRKRTRRPTCPMKKKKNNRKQRKYCKKRNNKSKSPRKSKNAHRIKKRSDGQNLKTKHLVQGVNDGDSICLEPHYLRRQHSRKCRLRHKMTDEGSGNICLIASKSHGANLRKGKEKITRKTVHWLVNDDDKDGKRQEYRRSPHPRVVRIIQNAKRQKPNVGIEIGVCERRQSYSTSKRSPESRMVKSRQLKVESKKHKTNTKRTDVAVRQYRRSPHSDKKRHLVVRRKSPQRRRQTNGKKTERKMSQEPVILLRNYLDKSNCSIKGNECASSCEANLSDSGYAYHQLMKQNRRLMNEAQLMKRCSSHGSNADLGIKKEVIEKFSSLISTCSCQKALDLHRILCLKENRHSTPRTMNCVLHTSTHSDGELSNEDEKNNNKSICPVNKASRHSSDLLIIDNQSLITPRLLQRVDSLDLIRKALGFNDSYQVPGPSHETIQSPHDIRVGLTATSASLRLPSSSKSMSKQSKNNTTQFQFMQQFDKQTLNNQTVEHSRNTNGPASNPNGRNICALEQNQSIKYDIRKGQQTNGKLGATTLGESARGPGKYGNLHPNLYCDYSGAFRPINHYGMCVDRQSAYSWPNPIHADGSSPTQQSGGDLCQELNYEIDELTAFGGCIDTNHIEKIRVRQHALEQHDSSIQFQDDRNESMANTKSQPKDFISLSKAPTGNEHIFQDTCCESLPFEQQHQGTSQTKESTSDRVMHDSVRDEKCDNSLAASEIDHDTVLDMNSMGCKKLPTLVLRPTATNTESATQSQKELGVVGSSEATDPAQSADNSSIAPARTNDDKTTQATDCCPSSEIATPREHIDSLTNASDIAAPDTEKSIQTPNSTPEQVSQEREKTRESISNRSPQLVTDSLPGSAIHMLMDQNHSRSVMSTGHNENTTVCEMKGIPVDTPNEETQCLNSSNNVETLNSQIDYERSKEVQGIPKQAYFEVRTPGLSTRWIISTDPLPDRLGHQSDDVKTASSFDSEVSPCVEPGLSNENGENRPSGSLSKPGGRKSASNKSNADRQCEKSTQQCLVNDCLGCSNNPGEPSSTSSETNNNNVTASLVCFPLEYQKDGISSLHTDENGRACVANGRCDLFHKDYHECGCPRVEPMTTLSFHGQKLHRDVSPLDLPEARTSRSQENQGTNQNGASRKNKGEAPITSFNPQKRHLVTISDDERNPEDGSHNAKRRRKESHFPSSKKSKIHFRRVRWQLLREIGLRKIRNESKSQNQTSTSVITLPDPIRPPSSDADSESSL